MRSRLGAMALAISSAMVRSVLALALANSPVTAEQFAELPWVLCDAGRCAGQALPFDHLVELHLRRKRLAVGTKQVVRECLPLLSHVAVCRWDSGKAAGIQP